MTPTKPKPRVATIDPNRHEKPGKLSAAGSNSDAFCHTILERTIDALWVKNSGEEQRERQLDAIIGAVGGLKPNDEIEGILRRATGHVAQPGPAPLARRG